MRLARASLAFVATAALIGLALGPPSGGQSRSTDRPTVSPSPGSRADTHAFPRTFHLYSSWRKGRALARYDMLVGFSTWDVAALRKANPQGIFLLQPGLDDAPPGHRREVFVTHVGGAYNWKGAQDETVGPIRAIDHNWDLLHEASGRRIGGWNLADPTGKGTPELVSKVFVYAAKKSGLNSEGWDGVHSDNWNFTSIGATWLYGPNLDTNRDKQVDDYAVLRRDWANGLTRTGRLIRSYLPKKIVGGNGNWWRADQYASRAEDPEGWLKTSNYTLVENVEAIFYNDSAGALALARRWLDYPDPYGQPRYIATMQRALTCDDRVLELPADADPNSSTTMLDPCTMKSMRWGLTLALMADMYYEIYVSGRHGTRWWYDEFDGGKGVRRRGYLGKALGPPVKLASGIYRRNFERGIALHNSTRSSVTVKLGQRFRRLRGKQNPTLNTGAVVRSVTVPGKDGIILLRRQR